MLPEISRADRIREEYAQGYSPRELINKYGKSRQATYQLVARVQRLPEVEDLRRIFSDRAWRLEDAKLFIGWAQAGAMPVEMALRFGINERGIPKRLRLLKAVGLISSPQVLTQRQIIQQLNNTDDVTEVRELLPLVRRHSLEINSQGKNPTFISLTRLAKSANLHLGFRNSIKPVQRGLEEAGIPYGVVPVVVEDGYQAFYSFTLEKFVPRVTEALSKSWRFVRKPEDICSRFRDEAYSYFIKQGIPDGTALELASKVLESEMPYIRGERGTFRIFGNLVRFHHSVIGRKSIDYHREQIKQEKVRKSEEPVENRKNKIPKDIRRDFLQSREHLFDYLGVERAWVLRLIMKGEKYSDISAVDERKRSAVNLRQLAFRARKQLSALQS